MKSNILRYSENAIDLAWYFASVVTVLVLYWLRPWLRSVWVAFQLSGPPAVPILGNVLMGLDSTKMRRLAHEASQKKYGPLPRGWILLRPIFGILEPKYLQLVLGNSKSTDKNFFYLFMHGFIGKGLITNNGNEWKTHRKYIQPYFNINILQTFIQSFTTSAQCLVKSLKGKEEVNITHFINESVLDILHEVVLGIPIKKNGVKSIVTHDSPYRKGQVMVSMRLAKPWLLFDKFYKWSEYGNKEEEQQENLHQYTKKILEQKREELKKGTAAENKCLMEMLIEISEKNKDFTDEDIIQETITFMLAGQDSVGAAAAFALFYLAKNPQIQEKVMEELNEIFQDDDRAPTNEDIRNMKYLEQCLKETLRLCPSVPFTARTLSEDVKLGKYTLPAQSDIIIAPYVTHRLEEYFPEPEKFDPDRFTPEKCEKRNPFAFIPFSAGVRNCIGYKFAYIEMKAIVSAVLRNYQLSVRPGFDVTLGYRVTLRAHGGIWIQLKPRKNAPLLQKCK